MNVIDPEAPPVGVRVRRIRRLRALDWTALMLLIAGGLNWALVGLFEVNLVSALFGPMSTLSRIIYALLGAAALYAIYLSTRLTTRA